MKNYYEVLEIQENADSDEIKKAQKGKSWILKGEAPMPRKFLTAVRQESPILLVLLTGLFFEVYLVNHLLNGLTTLHSPKGGSVPTMFGSSFMQATGVLAKGFAAWAFTWILIYLARHRPGIVVALKVTQIAILAVPILLGTSIVGER